MHVRVAGGALLHPIAAPEVVAGFTSSSSSGSGGGGIITLSTSVAVLIEHSRSRGYPFTISELVGFFVVVITPLKVLAHNFP